MADKLSSGVLPKPEALEKYQKPERTFQRRLSNALRLRDEGFLCHLYLVTSDSRVRPGMEVGEGEVERLKGEGLYPVWHVEEEWFKNEYDQKSRKNKQPKTSTMSEPLPVEHSTFDRPALVTEIESLRRELESERKHSELVTGQLAIKDGQIKAANEREQQTNVLMKDLHALMGNLQQRLPLPPGNASPPTESNTNAATQVHDVEVVKQAVSKKKTERTSTATGTKRKVPKKPSKKSPPKKRGMMDWLNQPVRFGRKKQSTSRSQRAK